MTRQKRQIAANDSLCVCKPKVKTTNSKFKKQSNFDLSTKLCTFRRKERVHFKDNI